jgi:hypothetical protein
MFSSRKKSRHVHVLQGIPETSPTTIAYNPSPSPVNTSDSHLESVGYGLLQPQDSSNLWKVQLSDDHFQIPLGEYHFVTMSNGDVRVIESTDPMAKHVYLSGGSTDEVSFAGTIMFDDIGIGEIISWDNDSNHSDNYPSDASLIAQARLPGHLFLDVNARAEQDLRVEDFSSKISVLSMFKWAKIYPTEPRLISVSLEALLGDDEFLLHPGRYDELKYTHAPDGVWEIQTKDSVSADDNLPQGLYYFVLMPAGDMRAIKAESIDFPGHIHLSGHATTVLLAGTILFSETKPGEVESWDNRSSDYPSSVDALEFGVIEAFGLVSDLFKAAESAGIDALATKLSGT